MRAPIARGWACWLFFAGAAMAQSPAVTSFTGASTFGSINGTDQTLGFSFVPTAAIQVSALGVWNETAPAALAQSHQVGLWTASGTLLASATVLTTSPLTGSFRYVSISPVTLFAGQTYVVGSAITSPYSDEYSRVPVSGGTVTTSSLITIGVSAVNGSAGGFSFPGTSEPVYLGRFGPNLLVAAAPTVPISSWTAGAAGLGLAAAGLLVLRRRPVRL